MATVRILLIVFIFLLFQITFAFVICDATWILAFYSHQLLITSIK
jgi:hypothetical protein